MKTIIPELWSKWLLDKFNKEKIFICPDCSKHYYGYWNSNDCVCGKIDICNECYELKHKLSASEALYGFVAYLTSVNETQDAAVFLVELVDRFCKKNGFGELREGWEKHIKL
jgi:hypothetical protein